MSNGESSEGRVQVATPRSLLTKVAPYLKDKNIFHRDKLLTLFTLKA